MITLTNNEKHPISVYSDIYSSHEKNYKSMNEVTFKGIDQIHKYIKRTCTFVFDRGYDANKEEVIKIVRLYMNRWRIEDYFRFKKQEFGFENFRVISLKSINNLNQLLSYAIGFIGILTEKMDKKLLTIKILERAKVIKTKLVFYYYQMKKESGTYYLMRRQE